jgi:hypothetical protein
VGDPHAGRLPPARGPEREGRAQLRLAGLVGVRPAPGQQPHLLDQAPAHHQVAPVQAERPGFAKQRFVVARVVGVQEASVALEPASRDRIRALVAARQGLIEKDLVHTAGIRRLWSAGAVRGEEQGAQQQEVQQRMLRELHGVHQTGDVQARSRIVSGISKREQSRPRARHT